MISTLLARNVRIKRFLSNEISPQIISHFLRNFENSPLTPSGGASVHIEICRHPMYGMITSLCSSVTFRPSRRLVWHVYSLLIILCARLQQFINVSKRHTWTTWNFFFVPLSDLPCRSESRLLRQVTFYWRKILLFSFLLIINCLLWISCWQRKTYFFYLLSLSCFFADDVFVVLKTILISHYYFFIFLLWTKMPKRKSVLIFWFEFLISF